MSGPIRWVRWARLTLVVIRPAALVIFGLFAIVGMTAAQPRHHGDLLVLAGMFAVLLSFLLFSVTLNDIADERIDRVNLQGDRTRPLVTGRGTRNELGLMAVVAASVAMTVALAFSWLALVVVTVGLAVSASYSLRPLRLAHRGAVASMVLPACYVAVPFLLGVIAARGMIGPRQLLLLAGLYLGFIGRIVLKDFRDVQGDAMFGKRTFLVRHGRLATVRFSAVFTSAGTALVVVAGGWSVAWVLLYLPLYGATLLGLRCLAGEVGHRREERLISALAVLGRGVVVLLVMRLETVHAGGRFTPAEWLIASAAFVALTLAQALSMARYGPLPPRIRPPAVPPPAGAVQGRADGRPLVCRR